jgi:hypothetical protein
MADWSARFGLFKAEISILLLASEGHDRATIVTIRGGSEAIGRNQSPVCFKKQVMHATEMRSCDCSNVSVHANST